LDCIEECLEIPAEIGPFGIKATDAEVGLVGALRSAETGGRMTWVGVRNGIVLRGEFKTCNQRKKDKQYRAHGFLIIACRDWRKICSEQFAALHVAGVGVLVDGLFS